MGITNVLWAIGIGSAFVFWPILARYSNTNGSWVTVLILFGTLFGGAGFSYPTITKLALPNISAIGYLLTAGFVNGVAAYFYTSKAVDPNILVGPFAITVTIVMVVMAPVFDLVLNGNLLTFKQGIGLLMALFAVYLLTS